MNNFDDLDDDIDHVLDAMSEQVAHNSRRLDQLLSRLQNRLGQDYTHIPIIIGSCMIVGSFFHIFFKSEWVFSLTALIWGALILSLTLFFKHRIAQNLTHFGDTLIKLDQDRQDHARKLAVIEKLIREGIPSGLTLNHVMILLGEYKDNSDSNGLDHDRHPENN